MGAMRNLPGIRANVLPGNNNLSTALVAIGFTVNFYGTNRTQCYGNNNGNMTFLTPNGAYTPIPMWELWYPMIAVYWGDVDTRYIPPEAAMTYGNDTVDLHNCFGLEWSNAGYFNEGPISGEGGGPGGGDYGSDKSASPTPPGVGIDKLNKFQLLLIRREDLAAGDFDLEFNYDQIQWETGSASGGVNGLGGVSATVGFAKGTIGVENTWFEMLGSRVPGTFIDTNLVTGLKYLMYNSVVAGRYVYNFRNGLPHVNWIANLVGSGACTGNVNLDWDP